MKLLEKIAEKLQPNLGNEFKQKLAIIFHVVLFRIFFPVFVSMLLSMPNVFMVNKSKKLFI